MSLTIVCATTCSFYHVYVIECLEIELIHITLYMKAMLSREKECDCWKKNIYLISLTIIVAGASCKCAYRMYFDLFEFEDKTHTLRMQITKDYNDCAVTLCDNQYKRGRLASTLSYCSNVFSESVYQAKQKRIKTHTHTQCRAKQRITYRNYDEAGKKEVLTRDSG